MVNVQKYQWVAIGDTIQECEKNYNELLNTNGIVNQTADKMKKVSGAITAIAPVVLEGNTHYYICVAGSSDIFDVDLADEKLIDIIKYNVGDIINLQYTQGYGLNKVRQLQ